MKMSKRTVVVGSLRVARVSRVASILLVASVSASCANQYINQLSQVSANSVSYHIPTELSVNACRDALAQSGDASDSNLESSSIHLVNWNVHRQFATDWKQDYDKFTNGKDLVLIQEASLQETSVGDIDTTMHWSFAPGYRARNEVSGVLTLSRVKPLAQCSYIILEPLLRTPKATSITQYGLTDTDETLIVVNVHAVNITLGMGAYRQQFRQIEETLAQHRGPIILSGDFNTWRARREQLVEGLAARLDMTAVQYRKDHRLRFFGKALDHVYVRGLFVIEADTNKVATSDHNPMSVTFSLQSLANPALRAAAPSHP